MHCRLEYMEHKGSLFIVGLLLELKKGPGDEGKEMKGQSKRDKVLETEKGPVI
jgi:hypothetical protein